LLLLFKFTNNAQGVKQYDIVLKQYDIVDINAINIIGAVTTVSVKLFNNWKLKELQK